MIKIDGIPYHGFYRQPTLNVTLVTYSIDGETSLLWVEPHLTYREIIAFLIETEVGIVANLKRWVALDSYEGSIGADEPQRIRCGG